MRAEGGENEAEMVRGHHRLNGRQQTMEDSGGPGSLACCSPWGCKESDMAEQLNKNPEFKLKALAPFLSAFPGDSLSPVHVNGKCQFISIFSVCTMMSVLFIAVYCSDHIFMISLAQNE